MAYDPAQAGTGTGTGPLQDTAATPNPVEGFTTGTRDATDTRFVVPPVTNSLPNDVPEAPGNLAAAPGAEAGAMVLTWQTPWHNGSRILRYRYRVSADGGLNWTPDWTAIPDSAEADPEANNGAGTPRGANAGRWTVQNLALGTEYTFQVQAVNGEGEGPAAEVTETLEADTTAPAFLSARTGPADGGGNAPALILEYGEALDAPAPAPSAFAVTVEGRTRAVSAVAVDGAEVTLTLADGRSGPAKR